MEVLFRSYELETANIIIGNYIKEDGFYIENGEPICGKPCTRHYIQDEDCIKHEIAEDYLSINFKDMIDSEGNKIFASLSEDGKGGDIVELEHIRYLEDDEPSYVIKGLCLFMNSSFFVEDIDNKFDRVFYDEEGRNFSNKELRVIGIQE